MFISYILKTTETEIRIATRTRVLFSQPLSLAVAIILNVAEHNYIVYASYKGFFAKSYVALLAGGKCYLWVVGNVGFDMNYCSFGVDQ